MAAGDRQSFLDRSFPRALTWTASLLLIAAVAVVDWLTPARVIVPILYVVPLVLCIQHNSRRLLWGFALLCVLLNFAVHFAQSEAWIANPSSISFLNRVLAAAVVVILAAIEHVLIGFQRAAEEAILRKTRFLAAISHDIRTPVNAISLLAELMRRTAANAALAAEIPRLAEKLQANAASLIELTNDLLDVARFDQGKLEFQESEFALNEVLAEECRQSGPLAQQTRLQLLVDTPDAPVSLRTDRVKLARILGNLIGNAIKFTEAGSVHVSSTVLPNRKVEIRVADTGVGIAPEHLPHIFDEFTQLRNPERDRSKGTGLGLAICQRLTEAMGGTIAVQSKPGKGTTFAVTLPASRVQGPPRALKEN